MSVRTINDSTAFRSQIVWQWSYLDETPDLSHLYEKAKTAQWNSESDINWATRSPRDEFAIFPPQSLLYLVLWRADAPKSKRLAAARDELGWLLSQLLHGEQAALLLCSQLTSLCPQFDQKLCLATQIVDEARHCEVLAKLLRRRFGRIYPIAGYLKALFDNLLAAGPWEKKCVGMHLLVESIAVGLFSHLKQATADPLVRQIVERIIRDESRHAAFGLISLGPVLRTLETPYRNELEDLASRVIQSFLDDQLSAQLNDILPDHGIDPETVTLPTAQLPIDRASLRLLMSRNRILKQTVSNLDRLGLITERTLAIYDTLGLRARVGAA